MSKIIIKAVKYNGTIEKAQNKFYLRAIHTETVTFKKLIKHITEHGSSYDRGTVTGVMLQAVDCIKELLLDSKRVELGDMGTFYAAVHSKGNELREKCTADTIENVYIRFLPSRSGENMLDSKTLRRQAEFSNLESRYVDEADYADDDDYTGGSGSGSGGEEMPLTPQD